ncbi:armadillo-type protein, partial [Tribonema minus]
MVLSTAQQIHSLLEKTSDWDKDERYMATSDLCTELQKDVKIEPQLERRVCAAVLKQLDDSSNDVQGIAVKCLGILLKKVQEAQVGEICDKLCTLILEGKPELRDIYSIGLKTLISDVPDATGPSVAKRLTARLLGGVQKEEAKLECLDNLTDLMRRFGHEVEPEHNRVIEALLVQLGQERAVVRKRATACLGSIAVVLSDALLNKLVVHLLAQIKGSDRADIVRTLIQAIGTISRTVGFRLGRHLDAIVPLFLKFIGDMDDEDMHTEAASELRDNCFQGFESFVLRCPREVTPHLDKILDVVLRFARYDPNYSYDSDDVDAEVGGGQQEEEEDFMEDDFGGGSDDDDTSWKVRRSALRVVRAIVTTRTERLEWLCGSCCDVLVSRFKEREENVRVDVFGCFTSLLEAAGAQDARQRQA